MAKVITIPATQSRYTKTFISGKKKRRVAGYARVSTDHEEQKKSYEAQVDYYKNYIKAHEGWEFVSVYTDEGISATSTIKRNGFNKMVKDALDGCIDLIITKSVSRFARNTVDSLTTIRKLKEHKVECYFEKENIWTFDSKGELLLTIMSSLAQEESRSISENVTWGQRKRFADGKVTVPFKRFLGYDRGEDGNLIINEEQAVIVRKIYGMFLQGLSPFAIAKKLTKQGIPTPGGKTNWSGSTVKSILTNEKYKGDALLQKVYTVDFLSKKKKVNKGEVPQYYVEHNHDAIIEPFVFHIVQEQMAVRQMGTNRQSSINIFSSRIKCGDCGSFYGSKIWHSKDKYRRVIWQCNHKFDGGKKCSTPHLYEETIKELFLKAVNILVIEKSEIIANFHAIKEQLFNIDKLKIKQSQLRKEQNMMEEEIKTQLDEINNIIKEKQEKREQIGKFLATLEQQNCIITEFDKNLWYSLLDFVTVFNKEDIRFTFKDGTEIKVYRDNNY